MKYFTIKEIALIAVLAAVTSTVEITLGSFMHAFGLKGTGTVLATIAMVIYFTAFSITKKKGTVVTIGFITAFIKLVYGWEMSKITPVLSIFGESVITEIILWFLPINAITGVITGISLKTFNLIFPYIVALIIGGKTAGKNILKFFYGIQDFINWLINLINIPIPQFKFIYIIIIGILWTIILGGILGYLAFIISKQVTKLHERINKEKSKKEEQKAG